MDYWLELKFVRPQHCLHLLIFIILLFKTNKFHRVISDSSVGSSKEPPLSEMNIKINSKTNFSLQKIFSQQNSILLLIDKILTKILSESFWNSSQFIQCHLKIFIQKLNYHLSKAVNQSFIFMIIKLQKKNLIQYWWRFFFFSTHKKLLKNSFHLIKHKYSDLLTCFQQR